MCSLKKLDKKKMVPNSETELEDFGRKTGSSACVVFKMMAKTP